MGLFKKLASNFKKLLKGKKASKSAAKPKKKNKPASKPKVKKAFKSKSKKAAKSKSKTKLKKKKVSKKKKAVKKSAPLLPKNYVKLGEVTHYFPHVEAGVIKIMKGTIAEGDEIHIKGATTDFKQRVESIQIDHKPVLSAKIGAEIGLQTKDKVRAGDVVYLIKPS